MATLRLSKVRMKLFLQNGGLLSGILKYTGGNVMLRAGDFALALLYTALLTTTEYGISNSVMTYVGFAGPALLLGIDNSIFHRCHAVKQGDKSGLSWRRYFSSNAAFAAVLLLSGGLLVLVFVGDDSWGWATNRQIPKIPYLAIILGGVFLRDLMAVGLAALRAEEKHGKVVGTNTVAWIGQHISALVLIYAGYGVVGYLVGVLIGAAAGVTSLALSNLRHVLTPVFCWDDVSDALKFGLPLLPHHLSFAAMMACDRVMLPHYCSMREIGIFSFAASLCMAASMIVTSVNEAWTPRYYDVMRQADSGTKATSAFTNLWFGAMSIVFTAGILFGFDIVKPLLKNQDLLQSQSLVGPICLISFSIGTYHLAATPLYYHGRTKLLPLFSGAGAVLNVLLNLFLIPRFGTHGAAFATVVSYTGITMACYHASRRLGLPAWPVFKILLIVCILIGAVIVNGLGGSFQSFASKAAIMAAGVAASWLFLLKSNYKQLFRSI